MTTRDFELDAVVIGGWRTRRPAAGDRARRPRRLGGRLRRQRRRRSTRSTPAQLPFDEPGAADRLRSGGGRRAAARRRPTRRSSADGRERHRGHRHPGRRAPEPRPARHPARAGGCARRTSATASCWYCAAPCTRASPRWSSGCIARLGARHRRRLLPRADRRGQGHDRAVRAAADRLRPDRRGRGSGPARCSAGSPSQIVQLSPEEAELAKLFTNTWRYIKFAAANQFYMMANDRGLDFERIRAGPGAGLPARGRHAGARASPPGRACSRTPCSWRRSTTTTSPSATRRCRSTRACRCTWCTGWSSATTWPP